MSSTCCPETAARADWAPSAVTLGAALNIAAPLGAARRSQIGTENLRVTFVHG